MRWFHAVRSSVTGREVIVLGVILVFALSRGTQRVLTGLALLDMGPWTASAASLVLACALWIPVAAWRGWLRANRSLWLRSIPLGLINIAVPGVAFIAAQQHVSAAIAALLVAALPLVVAVLAAVLLREHLGRVAVVGLVVGTVGVAALALGKGGAIEAGNWWIGIGLITVGILAAASVYVGWRSLLAEYPATVLLGPQLVICAVVVTPIAIVVSGVPNLGVSSMLVLTGLAIVNYVAPQIAMFWLLTRTTAVRAALANYLAPLFAALIAVPVLEQRVSGPMVGGGVLIVAGAAMVNTARNRRRD